MLVSAYQIDPASLALIIQRTTSGAAFSGNITSYVANGGWLGNNVVGTTGDQSITGIKRFFDSPRVPYSGTSGSAPSARWVNDQISAYSGWAANTYILSAALTATGAALYTLIVNSSGALTGQIGAGGGGSVVNVVYRTGAQLISGVKTFVSSPLIPPAFDGTPTAASAINLNDLLNASGVLAAGGGGGGGAPNAVFQSGDQTISGLKTFTGAVSIGIPTSTGHAVNLGLLIAASGAITSMLTGIGAGTSNTYYITGTGTVNINAFASGNQANSYSVTSGTLNVVSSGIVSNIFNAPVTQNTNIGTVTGNFVNMSFYFDEYNLITGLNLLECFVSRNFTFTGYGLGVWQSGSAGFLSGSLYQRNTINTKTRFIDFSLNSGVVWYASGGFNQTISGMNRVGIDIYRLSTGVTGFTVGAFGFGL